MGKNEVSKKLSVSRTIQKIKLNKKYGRKCMDDCKEAEGMDSALTYNKFNSYEKSDDDKKRKNERKDLMEVNLKNLCAKEKARVEKIFKGEKVVNLFSLHRMSQEIIGELMENKKYYPKHWVGGIITYRAPDDDESAVYGGLYGTIDNIPVYKTILVDPFSMDTYGVFLVAESNASKVINKVTKLREKNDIDLPWDKIILEDKVKERFYKSTVGFLENEELRLKFKEHYMKFKRCILLYGPPGNGKSTLITYLRAVAEKKEWIFESMTLKKVGAYGSRIGDGMRKSIYVFEDIDCIMTQRDGTIHGEKGELFSDVLNLLDGAGRANNYLVVMTANNYEVLDQAIIRDGRSDEKIYIPFPTNELKEQYVDVFIKYLVKEKDLPKIREFMGDEKVSFASLDNLRKKIFIYGSVDKALKMMRTEDKENKALGFKG